MNCKICNGPTESLGTALMLKKYEVRFFHCRSCEFVQVEEPYWLDEAYSRSTAEIDLWQLSRTLANSRFVKALILSFFSPQARFVDFGGGYGLFTRRMRDLGFNYFNHDKYCPNLFAHGFKADDSGNTRYELLTAFEVFEHLPAPMDTLSTMMRMSGSILLSTELLPKPVPGPRDWHYYGLWHGMHTSFYSLAALQRMADRFNLNVVSNGRTLHLLTPKKISPQMFRLIINPKISGLLHLIRRRPSLLSSDVDARELARE